MYCETNQSFYVRVQNNVNSAMFQLLLFEKMYLETINNDCSMTIISKLPLFLVTSSPFKTIDLLIYLLETGESVVS